MMINTLPTDDAYEKMVTFLSGFMNQKKTRNGKQRSIKFPMKLMYILECGEYSHIIMWNNKSDDNSFIILDVPAFEAIVLPTLFKVSKYESFQRKLYRWGFLKAKLPSDMLFPVVGGCQKTVSFVHALFPKGDYAAASRLVCSGPQLKAHKQIQKEVKEKRNKACNEEKMEAIAKLASNSFAAITNASDASISSSDASRSTSTSFQPRRVSDPTRVSESIMSYGGLYGSGNTIPAMPSIAVTQIVPSTVSTCDAPSKEDLQEVRCRRERLESQLLELEAMSNQLFASESGLTVQATSIPNTYVQPQMQSSHMNHIPSSDMQNFNPFV
ncbi:hypothetical protein CTEN210_10071 [Chaetoceros tenuissimus]|uniref:HSF-type DNA-binding domain-containing protein n=1 Tax=Chaetoceros tenuissimus TaxID=426638 RepID=A0AAD3CYZ2_9STRA|nr:hypothetical protein CTEN210_10071 [Chaetoceros tenuissimus]